MTATTTAATTTTTNHQFHDTDFDDNPNHNQYLKQFQEDGYITIEEFLSKKTCHELRMFILNELEQTLSSLALSRQTTNNNNNNNNNDTNDDNQQQQQEESLYENQDRFSAIREPQHRWDLKLPLTGIVQSAMKTILQKYYHSLIVPMAQINDDDDGDDDESDNESNDDKNNNNNNNNQDDDSTSNTIILAELGALISEPGAPAQTWHADSMYGNAFVICCFMTLQDTPVSMGPTQVLPGTHTRTFHEMAICNFPPKGLLRHTISTQQALVNGYEHIGDACIMDTRLYHRGGANTSRADDNNDNNNNVDDENDSDNTDNNDDDDQCSFPKNIDPELLELLGMKDPNNNNDDEQESSSYPNRRVVFYFSFYNNQKTPDGFLFTLMDHLKGTPLVSLL